MGTIPLFRTCNQNGDHFYTTDRNELLRLRDQYALEFEGFEGHLSDNADANTAPFHRLLGPEGHLYTADINEVRNLTNSGWRVEGVIGHIATTQVNNTTPLYRLKHPGIPDYFYTTNHGEYKQASSNGWVDQGISGYVWKEFNSGELKENFYAKEDVQQWWISITYSDGSWKPGAGIPQNWHQRTYRINPPGYVLVRYSVQETTKNNNATWTDEERSGSHYITLGVKDRAIFGASNWVGVEVTYEVKRGY